MKIAILGTRGIPNHYGGFEQITEYLSVGLVQRGHDVTVYNSHNHPYPHDHFKGVRVVHCYDPEYLIKTAGQFVYDLNCILHARRQGYDVVLFMGYTSSSIWARLFPREAVIISNMDGMEWQRAKYSRKVQRFLRYAERLAVRYSDFHIADSPVIQAYLNDTYGIRSQYIPYGASTSHQIQKGVLRRWGLSRGDYYMLMARMEPENNIEPILEGYLQATTQRKFVVVGNTDNQYGHRLLRRFGREPRIRFTGAIYDYGQVHTLRALCRLYFHGHSVGGTNPSLLEAMGSRALVAAHDNPYNRAILDEDAYYFSGPGDVARLIKKAPCAGEEERMRSANFGKVSTLYHWENIIDQYESYIYACYNAQSPEPYVYPAGYAGR
jgi:glycosyltransferase involved in cell wall biosynthesis